MLAPLLTALLASPAAAVVYNAGSRIVAGLYPPDEGETLMYLTVGGGMANGTPVVVDYDLDQNDGQRQAWVTPGPWGTHFKRSIRVAGTTLCLDAGENPQNGSKVKIWKCYDGLRQQTWEWVGYQYRLVGTNLCLDKTDGLTVPGTQVQVWECVDGNTNQEWGFTPRGPCGPNACTTWPYPGSTPSVMYR